MKLLKDFVNFKKVSVTQMEMKNAINSFFHMLSSSLCSNAFYLMLNNISTALLGFVFWKVITIFYTPAEVGIGVALLTASSLVAAIGNMGLGSGIIRFVPRSGAASNKIINIAFTMAGLVAILMSLLYLLCVEYWSQALMIIRETFGISLAFVLISIATGLSNLIDHALLAGRATQYVFLKNSVISLLKIPIPIFVFFSAGGLGIYLGTGVALGLGIIISGLFILPKVHKEFFFRPALVKSIIKKILPYSFTNYAAGLLNGSPGYIYPLIVINLLGEEYNAYFYIPWVLCTAIMVIPTGLSNSLFAEGSHDARSLARDGRRALLLSLILTIPTIGAIQFLSEWILDLFGPNYSIQGSLVLKYLSLSVFPMSISLLFIAINQVKKKLILIIAQAGLTSFLTIGLGYFFIIHYGILGIGIAYTVSNIIVALVVVWPLLNNIMEKDTTKGTNKLGYKR